MVILKNVPSPNIQIIRQEENDVWLEPEMRDMIPTLHWFYWHFAVEGAENKTVRFHMGPHPVVGYWGAAARRPGEGWRWAGTPIEDYTGFEYTFGPQESRVEFCHDFHYSFDRWTSLMERLGLKERCGVLTRSEKGRDVPLLRLGEGPRCALIACRHHACESTGSYVLEGLLEEYLRHPLPQLRLLILPFMDLDGVLDGDQGKNRFPHDHNRDYSEAPIYRSVQAAMALAREEKPEFAFDLHSPWHFGDTNDHFYMDLFFVNEQRPTIDRFRAILEKESENDPPAVRYRREYDEMLLKKHADRSPNQKVPNFKSFFAARQESNLICTMEMPYFGDPPHQVNEPDMLRAGATFLRAFERYLREEGK